MLVALWVKQLCEVHKALTLSLSMQSQTGSITPIYRSAIWQDASGSKLSLNLTLVTIR